MSGTRLEINSPLSSTTIDRLVSEATAHRPRTIIDHGCGWGALLLRAAAAAPGARCRGLDVDGPHVDRGRRAAVELGLADRVTFEVGSSTDEDEVADLVISTGAFHAFGSLDEALSALAERVGPGGRLLFGIEYWRALPTTEELDRMWEDASVTDCLGLPELVETLHHHQWRILDMHDSTSQEFDAFEVGHLREREEWLLHHADDLVRAEQEAAWTSWLRGHRRSMGFVTFVLARTAR